MGTLRRHRPKTTTIARTLSLAPSAYVAAAVALGAIGTAGAQAAADDIAPVAYERFAFDAADTNGDGFVSEGELARDAAAGFSGLDKDRSGT